jgi:iron complex outermembrane receptor protein
MWDWQISPALEWTNAARIDHLALHYDGVLLPIPGRMQADFNTSLSVVSFNSGLVIRLGDTDSVRLTISRGLQLPSLIDLGVQLDTFGLTLLGSPHLRPTSVWDAEVAYDHALPLLGATAEAAVFFERNTNLIAGPGSTPIVPFDGRLTSTAANIGSSNEIGMQLGLRGETTGGLRWNASYRYTTIVDDVRSDILDTATTAPDVGTPRHVVTLGAGYTKGRWELDLRARGQTSFSDYQGLYSRVTVPDYVSCSASAGFRVAKGVFLQGTAEQFNVTRILQGAASYVDRRFIAAARVEW